MNEYWSKYGFAARLAGLVGFKTWTLDDICFNENFINECHMWQSWADFSEKFRFGLGAVCEAK